MKRPVTDLLNSLLIGHLKRSLNPRLSSQINTCLSKYLKRGFRTQLRWGVTPQVTGLPPLAILNWA